MTYGPAAIFGACVAGAALLAVPAPDERAWSRAALAATVRNSCLDCHSVDDPEGGAVLSAIAEDPASAPAGLLRRVRDRLARRDMPPGDDSDGRPSARGYERLVWIANAELDRRADRAAAGAPTLRRLNRFEYRNTVRDLLGVDVAVDGILPADDVGEGFDSIGSVLSLSPIALEKYLAIAERVAIEAIPPDPPRGQRRVEGRDLEIRRGGQRQPDFALVWSAGAAESTFELPRAGRYLVRFGAWGMQAGPDPVRAAIVAGDEPRAPLVEFALPETRAAPGERFAEVDLPAGPLRLGVAFLNDFFDQLAPEGQRDRNLVVTFLEVDGPLDRVWPTAQALAMMGDDRAAFARSIAFRAFRRPPTEETVAELLDLVRDEPDDGEAMRTIVVRALVDPRFLFRVEGDPPDGEEARPLDDFELATRLSYFLWASMPDDDLFAAAAAGELATDDGLRRAADRLIESPRSIAIAERFGRQWLHVAGVHRKMPDPELLGGASPAETASLLADLEDETTLFLDAILREGRPLEDLLAAEWTFLNERLAGHYGVGGVSGPDLRRVELGDARPPGLLGHGSVLVATSNPSRTSPVKRGKWVLESLLDSPPPPPPPGVQTLPERREKGDRETARAQLARHRADPNCAGCHVRMDEIGLAFEGFDAVGRPRANDGSAAIDTAARLPDGRAFDGPRELAAILRADPGFRRSVAKHLLTYALGRGLSGDDEATVDRIARDTSDRSLRGLVHAIIRTDQFRRRSQPPPPTVTGASS
jgi:hypothetical protein